MEQQAYTAVSSRYDTPPADVYRRYDERKHELWLTCKTEEDYQAALADLIDELGI